GTAWRADAGWGADAVPEARDRTAARRASCPAALRPRRPSEVAAIGTTFSRSGGSGSTTPRPPAAVAHRLGPALLGRCPLSRHDLAHQPRGLRRRLADPHSGRLQGNLLSLGGARRAGDDRTRVAHGLAR